MKKTIYTKVNLRLTLLIISLLIISLFAAACNFGATTSETTPSSTSETQITEAQTRETTTRETTTREEQTADTDSNFQPNGGVYRTISPEDAYDWLTGDDPPLLLDVRTQSEYEEGHIADSILIPIDDLAARIDELPQDRDAPLIVYCRSGRRSADATSILFDHGFTNVYDLGGIISWPYNIVLPD